MFPDFGKSRESLQAICFFEKIECDRDVEHVSSEAMEK